MLLYICEKWHHCQISMSSQVICKLRIHTYLICDCLFVDGLSNQPAVLLTQHTLMKWFCFSFIILFFRFFLLILFFFFASWSSLLLIIWNAYAILYILFLFLLRYCSITEWYNGSFICIYTACHYCFNIHICYI